MYCGLLFCCLRKIICVFHGILFAAPHRRQLPYILPYKLWNWKSSVLSVINGSWRLLKMIDHIDMIIDLPPLFPEPKPKWTDECCTYRVPQRLRQVKEEAYTPKLISIGPFHHDKEELRDMEALKLRYYHRILSTDWDRATGYSKYHWKEGKENYQLLWWELRYEQRKYLANYSGRFHLYHWVFR